MTTYSGDASTRLTAVREAIDDCLSAQAYTIRGREKRMAELKVLREMEKDLQREVQEASVAGTQMAGVGRYVRTR